MTRIKNYYDLKRKNKKMSKVNSEKPVVYKIKQPQNNAPKKESIGCSADCNRVIRKSLEDSPTSEYQENIGVLMCNNKLEVIHQMIVGIGIANECIVTPREIFRAAVATGAVKIILFHNHPSGNSLPSSSDINLTKRVVEAGKILGIDLLDHIIIGEANYYTSFADLGLLR